MNISNIRLRDHDSDLFRVGCGPDGQETAADLATHSRKGPLHLTHSRARARARTHTHTHTHTCARNVLHKRTHPRLSEGLIMAESRSRGHDRVTTLVESRPPGYHRVTAQSVVGTRPFSRPPSLLIPLPSLHLSLTLVVYTLLSESRSSPGLVTTHHSSWSQQSPSSRSRPYHGLSSSNPSQLRLLSTCTYARQNA